MNRIETAFNRKPIFMPYYPLGFPDIKTSIDVIEALAQNGADLIEVGLSFSDPIADGPVIQQATQMALKSGITVKKAFAAIAELRQRGVNKPLVMMGYYNPLLAHGLENVAQDASLVGVDGIIIPDLPREESEEFEHVLRIANTSIPLIRMIAPTTTDERMKVIARDAIGFIYLVSVTGITGERREISAGLKILIERVRTFTTIPVCVGFGIGTPEQAKMVGEFADGVIVGSACVRTVGESRDPTSAAQTFARQFKDALTPHM